MTMCMCVMLMRMLYSRSSFVCYVLLVLILLFFALLFEKGVDYELQRAATAQSRTAFL